ncbi:MAG TPA: tripartite tricarboxylate transporter substrate-binding protein [Burkholderiales bacterium]|nr:tripartite tricarboxylate transporter substrate-binding protein [Burkholderiales bacterium]
MLRKWLPASLLLAFSLCAHAQQYPDKPIRVIVPFAAGTGTDILARIVTEELRTTLNASFVIDNRAGASGQIAAELAAKANPDGYTLLLGTNTTHSANPFLFKKINYDPVRDFAGVSRMIYYVFVLAVSPASNVKTPAELIAYVKANPGKTSYGFGNSTGQVNGAFLASAAKLDSIPVPYKSTPPAMTDLIGGRIHWMLVDAAASQGHIKAGRLRALAVMSDKPVDTMPELPPLGATVPGFDINAWAGMFAPAKTPGPIVAKLGSEIVKTIGKRAINQKLIDNGLQPVQAGPAELDRFVRQQLGAWGKKIKAAGIEPE